MEKLPMCRICLAENVRMYAVVNKNLHELYEKLTDVPFVTEDSRPILVCFFCCTKLKQSYQLRRQCLEAEEMFAQMLNEDYEPNPLINQARLQLFSGFIKTPIEHISIVDECQTESIAVKEEIPAVCHGLDVLIEPKKEYQSDELEPENFDNSFLDVAVKPPYHSESDFEDDEPLMQLKTEVEDEEVYKEKQRPREMKSAIVAKKGKLENAITAEQTKQEKSDSEVNRIKKRTSTPGTYSKESYECDVCQHSFSHESDLTEHNRIHTGEKPYKCSVCQRSFSAKGNLSRHIRIHTGEKPYKCFVCQRSFSEKEQLSRHIRIHTGEKPYKCNVCQRSFSDKGQLSRHIRIHTGEKPYKCDVCQRSFSETGHLSRHIRIHTGEKPYKCDICHCSFSQKNNLKVHFRIHTGEKPYKCDICQRSFSVKISLTEHNRTHTGEKP